MQTIRSWSRLLPNYGVFCMVAGSEEGEKHGSITVARLRRQRVETDDRPGVARRSPVDDGRLDFVR